MIEGLGNHRLSDFVLFSREALYSVFESYNADIWPLQLVWAVLAVMVFLLLRRGDPGSQRIALGIFGGAWLWVALAFHLRYFLPINWAATYFAWLFVIEAVMLFSFAMFGAPFAFDKRAQRAGTEMVGIVLFVAAALVPLGLLLGQGWRQTLLFGWGPDATALGTLGGLLAAKGRWAIRIVLMIPPIIWCAIAALIYYGAR
jgi:hypothetical protein